MRNRGESGLKPSDCKLFMYRFRTCSTLKMIPFISDPKDEMRMDRKGCSLCIE